MKGDFSRRTFDPTKHYRGVLMQQGRVQVDADWNEEVDAAYARTVTDTLDEIGASGYPSAVPDSFKIGIASNAQDLTIGTGRMYVDGILCVKDRSDSLLTQRDLPLASPALAGFPDLPPAAKSLAGTYCVYLDVWDRHITAVEDPSIREKALGGADTATRVQTVWQVRLQRIGDLGGRLTCADFVEPRASAAQLKASIQPAGAAKPCVLPPQTGYRRLENQLYRVEIHTPGALGKATFKWSRENGAVVTAILPSGGGSGLTFPVQTTGRDEVLGFASNQWVELLDDRRDLIDHHGQLLQIASVDPAVRTITVKPVSPGPTYDPALHPKLRLWNQQGGSELAGGVPVTAGPIALEDGLQIEFQGKSFATGDYWLIPARTAIDNTVGNIEWPEESPGVPAWLPPSTENHHYAPLALVGFDGKQFQTINGAVPDCRARFDDLVTLTKRKSGTGCCTISVGPDDAAGGAALQSVIDQYKGKGPACICLQPGVYSLSATLRLDEGHSRLTISGCPGGAILQAAAASNAPAAFTDGLICITHASGVKLESLTLRLPAAPYPLAPYARQVQASIGIRAMDCADLTVRNCAFQFPDSTEGSLFGAGVFGGGICTGWTIERNRFTGSVSAYTAAAGTAPLDTKDPAGITRRRQFAAGLLVHPDLMFVPQPAGTPKTQLVRAGFGGARIADNTFEGLAFASLITADSGDVRCTGNEVHHCYEGFWFLSLESLDLLTPGQEISVDPAYNQSVAVWVGLIASAFQEVTFATQSALALLYTVPPGWTPDPVYVVNPIDPVRTPVGRSFAQKLTDHASGAIRNVVSAFAQRVQTGQPAPVTPAPPVAPVAPISVKLPAGASVGAATDTVASTLRSFIKASAVTSTRPLFSLSLDFSNNNIDIATDQDSSGGGLMVVDSDLARVSVITLTSNRLRNGSTLVPAAVVSLVDAVTITGNQILNEAAYDQAAPTTIGRPGTPISLLYFPINAKAAVMPCAVTGNLLFGVSNLGSIKRNFAAPLDDWLFANTQL